MSHDRTLREFTWSSLATEPAAVADALLARDGIGAVRITSSQHQPLPEVGALKTAALAWAKTIGNPIVVYKRTGLWKQIGVSLERGADRAGGAGDIPLHIDLVNASLPPDFVMFLCDRSAGAQRGQSVVSPFRPALRALDAEVFADLGRVVIREGRFFDLENVGAEKNPFPLLERKGERIEWVRFTGKSTTEIVHGSEASVRSLHGALRACEVDFYLAKGDAFIVNQRLAAHGRRSLNLTGDAASAEALHRSLWQLFVRGRAQTLSKCFVYPS